MHAWLDLIMSTIVAPQFAADQLTVVSTTLPIRPRWRVCARTTQVADRFEVFCGDLELANGYVELTRRQEATAIASNRISMHGDALADPSSAGRIVIAALDAGLPDCAGVAVGIERLQMLLEQTDDISDVVTFLSETS